MHFCDGSAKPQTTERNRDDFDHHSHHQDCTKTKTKKTDNKLTPEQIEAFGNEIDAIRQRLIGELGEEDANYIRGIVKKQRQFEVAGRALMYLPAGLAARGRRR